MDKYRQQQSRRLNLGRRTLFRSSLFRQTLDKTKDLIGSLFLVLFPSRCMLCHQTVSDAVYHSHVELCSSCFESQPLNDYCCKRCAQPLPPPEKFLGELSEAPLCGRCIRRLPEFDYVKSLFRYEDEIINLVHQLKFSEKISYARSISELLLQVVDKDDLPDCFLPVPLHPSRLFQRGYNQSIEISRVLSRKTGIAIEVDAIIRRHRTQSQTDLNAKQRQKNIRGAYEAVKPIDAKHVLIVDDVMTTGATVNELARLLKRKGIQRVGVLCIARAPIK